MLKPCSSSSKSKSFAHIEISIAHQYLTCTQLYTTRHFALTNIWRLKFKLLPATFHYGRQTSNKEHATMRIDAMLLNLSKLQTFTLFHREEFFKNCISNISEILLQKFMETLISSSHSSLHQIIFNLFYSYMKVEGLCGAWQVKTILTKQYILNFVKLRERSIGFTETSQKGHGKQLLYGEGERWNTHVQIGGHVQVASG